MTMTGRTNYVYDSRSVRPLVIAGLRRLHDGRLAILAPAVGLWRDRPPLGTLIRPGGLLGRISVLEVDHALVAPEGARGVVVEVVSAGAGDGPKLAQYPVTYGEQLLVLDRAMAAGADEEDAEVADEAAGGLVLRAPSSGRFYRRPAPSKPAFVAVGEIIETGKVIGLLEVMKTFTRIQYGGGNLPPRARVMALHAEDEADVAAGEALLEVEPV